MAVLQVRDAKVREDDGLYTVTGCDASNRCRTMDRAVRVSSRAPVPYSFYDAGAGAYYLDETWLAGTKTAAEMSAEKKNIMLDHLYANANPGWQASGKGVDGACLDVSPCVGFFKASGLCCNEYASPLPPDAQPVPEGGATFLPVGVNGEAVMPVEPVQPQEEEEPAPEPEKGPLLPSTVDGGSSSIVMEGFGARRGGDRRLVAGSAIILLLVFILFVFRRRR
jgi:hypothetical protein